jgi:hypothetical protein
LEEIFRDQVLKFLIHEGRTEPEFAEKIRNWRHSGFGVHRGKRIGSDDREGLERVACYIVRNSFSLEKITYNEQTGSVIYRSKKNYNTKRNFEVFSAEDFIGAITQHIPDKFFQNIRYYGWYSNKSRGQRKRLLRQAQCRQGSEEADDAGGSPFQAPRSTEVINVSSHQPRRIPTKHWRELIKKVWEVDPLCCPKCEGEMKVISLIDCPASIRVILKRFSLWDTVNEMVRSRSPPIEEFPEAHLFPGGDSQFALPLGAVEFAEGACPEYVEGVDEIPPDDVPTIIYS